MMPHPMFVCQLLSGTVTDDTLKDICDILKIPTGYAVCDIVFILYARYEVIKGDLNHPNHFIDFMPFLSDEVETK